MNQWRKAISESASGRSRSSSAVSPFHSGNLTLALLLITTIPPCTGAPMFPNPSTADREQLLKQIDNLCSFFLSEERPITTYNVVQDLCGMVLGVLQKSQEQSPRETSKRFLFHYTKPNNGVPDGTSAVFHPLLQLVSQLSNRRRRRVASQDYLQVPRTMQSRGYFLYRPRNGRRSTEYV